MTLLRARAAELGVQRSALPALLGLVQVAEQAFVQARVEIAAAERAADGK